MDLVVAGPVDLSATDAVDLVADGIDNGGARVHGAGEVNDQVDVYVTST
ncbi:MAG TPA: hypothetical protein VNO33_09695 [Kofleriaceae bacterium]|nr:hypothetical protein [Kofleriaceae bacterium]